MIIFIQSPISNVYKDTSSVDLLQMDIMNIIQHSVWPQKYNTYNK